MSDDLEGTRGRVAAGFPAEEPISIQSALDRKPKDPSFGEQIQWTMVQHPDSYYPTRLEYFAGKALQGLVTGRSEKDHRKAVLKAMELAIQLEGLCDKAQGG